MLRILNFRDIAKLAPQIRPNLIFRSGHPDKLKRNAFSHLGIRTIIDLRQDSERKHARIFDQVKTVNLPINFDAKVREAIHPILLRRNCHARLVAVLKAEFAHMVESQKSHLKILFDLLKDPGNYPLLIHCRAGKDRTGFMVVMIELVLGYSQAAIQQDFLLSNKFFLPAALKSIRAFAIFTLGLVYTGNLKYLSASHGENLGVIMETLVTDYGCVENYLESCGINSADLAAVRAIHLSKSGHLTKTESILR